MVVMAMLRCSESQFATSLPSTRPTELADRHLDSRSAGSDLDWSRMTGNSYLNPVKEGWPTNRAESAAGFVEGEKQERHSPRKKFYNRAREFNEFGRNSHWRWPFCS